MSTNAETIRRLRAEAALRGDCYVCRCRPAKPGRRNCQVCIDRSNAASAAAEATWRKTGKCVRCGDRRLRGYLHCAACNAKRIARARAKVERGTCARCGKAQAPGHTLCEPCLAAMSVRAKERRADLIARGLCSVDGCGANLESASLCFGHLMRMRRYHRARRAA